MTVTLSLLRDLTTCATAPWVDCAVHRNVRERWGESGLYHEAKTESTRRALAVAAPVGKGLVRQSPQPLVHRPESTGALSSAVATLS